MTTNLISSKSGRRIGMILTAAVLLLFVPAVAFAQDVDLGQAQSTLQNFARQLMSIIQVIIGIVGVMMIAWVLYKRMKGDQQSNDALMGWLVALAIGILALQLIKVLFIRA